MENMSSSKKLVEGKKGWNHAMSTYKMKIRTEKEMRQLYGWILKQ